MAISKIINLPKVKDVEQRSYASYLNWDSNKITFSSTSPTHCYSNGYCARLIFCFTTKQNISSYTPICVLKDPKLIPNVSINSYGVGLISNSIHEIFLQILDTGDIRIGSALAANVDVKFEITYPIKVGGGKHMFAPMVNIGCAA